MQDSVKAFLIALVTSVAVLFILGPIMLKVHGLHPATATPATTPAQAQPATGTAPQKAATPAPAMTAPNIEGMSAREARDRFRAQGITIIEDGERVDASAKPGTILQQIPSGGAPLEQKEIRVIVAKAPELIAVPNVVGKKLEQARDELVEGGFEVPEASFEPAEEPGGTVVRQEPNAGAKTEQGAIVRLVVAEDTVKVPKLRGKPISGARKAIEKAGLVVGKVSEREDEELSGRRVLSQSPEAGAQAQRGSPVDLVIVAPD
jgi:serine/threonine-protein kinase